MASSLLGMQVLRKELWVRVPCPPLCFCVKVSASRFLRQDFCVKPNFPAERFVGRDWQSISASSQTFLRKDLLDVLFSCYEVPLTMRS